MKCPICNSNNTIVLENMQVNYWMYVATKRMCRNCERIYSIKSDEDYSVKKVVSI
jgi:transcriptional regulator NrdR family protein